MGDQTVYIRCLPYKTIKEKLGRLIRGKECGGGAMLQKFSAGAIPELLCPSSGWSRHLCLRVALEEIRL
jgi:hypothetical protein